MYLSVNECDLLDIVIKSFEVSFRSYISHIIISKLPNEVEFKTCIDSLVSKTGETSIILSGKMTSLLKRIQKNHHEFYLNLEYANKCYLKGSELDEPHDVSYVSEIIGLSYIFATNYFSDLLVFKTKEEYLFLSATFYNVRNSLSHRGSELISDDDMLNSLCFVSEIGKYISNIDSNFFWYRNKNDIDKTINILLRPDNDDIPIKINNINEISFSDKKFVCRETELQSLQELTYKKLEYLKKPTSICVYGYGGVGKTALIHEFLKLLIKDMKDKVLPDNYYDFILFFTAKDEKLSFDRRTGNIEVVTLVKQFKTLEELKGKILDTLKIKSLENFNKKGIIIIDNFETITNNNEHDNILKFIQYDSPSNIQYILTSRPPEKLDTQILIQAFDETEGYVFIDQYIDENEINVELSEAQKIRLLELSQGNALVLVLSLNRLDSNLVSFNAINDEFRNPKFSEIEHELEEIPPMAFEIISDYMYRNTIQEIEYRYSTKKELIFIILKSLAVYEKALDEYTLCILTNIQLHKIKEIMNILCRFMIVEKSNDLYIINEFANRYILEKFIPSSIEKNQLYMEIKQQVRDIKRELNELERKSKQNKDLQKILHEWLADTYGDKIAISKAYTIYNDMKYSLRYEAGFILDDSIEKNIERFNEISKVTIHPYVDCQKATTLSLIAQEMNTSKYFNEIKKAYEKCISNIRWYYQNIKSTRSFAIILWKYGIFLLNNGCDLEGAVKYLEESIDVFRLTDMNNEMYYKCLSLLGNSYISMFSLHNNLVYINEARNILAELQQKSYMIDKKHIASIKAGIDNVNVRSSTKVV